MAGGGGGGRGRTVQFWAGAPFGLGVPTLVRTRVCRQIEHGSGFRDLDDPRGGGADGMSEEEARLKSEVSRGLSNVDRDRAIVASTREKVAAYEEGFNKIRAATGISSIEELVATFIQNEVG
jgi:hypothetical protein